MSVQQCPQVILTAGMYNPHLMATSYWWVTAKSLNGNDKIENNDEAVTVIVSHDSWKPQIRHLLGNNGIVFIML